MSKEYFELFGVLLGIYAFFRLVIWLGFFEDRQTLPPSDSGEWEPHPIDASQIAQRLQDVRRDYTGEARAHRTASTKPLRVAERREEIAKLAFFHKPPPPDPEPPHDQGLLFI